MFLIFLIRISCFLRTCLWTMQKKKSKTGFLHKWLQCNKLITKLHGNLQDSTYIHQLMTYSMEDSQPTLFLTVNSRKNASQLQRKWKCKSMARCHGLPLKWAQTRHVISFFPFFLMATGEKVSCPEILKYVTWFFLGSFWFYSIWQSSHPRKVDNNKRLLSEIHFGTWKLMSWKYWYLYHSALARKIILQGSKWCQHFLYNRAVAVGDWWSTIIIAGSLCISPSGRHRSLG